MNLSELAMQEWLNCGNIQQAHRIWHERILPLYMNKGTGVQLVKALQFGADLT